MALWGTADAVYATGTITVDLANKTITGSGTTFTNAAVGDVISIGVGNTFGEAVISAVTSNTAISIASTQFLANRTMTGVAYTISQKPKYTLEDSNYGADEIFGVDIYEVGAAATTKYAVAHGGWVGINTYNDMHGTLRVKSEVLVAMSGISTGATSASVDGDAADDTTLKDYLITIVTQPASKTGVSTTANTSFSVSASVSPITDLSYQWQYASSVGAAYTNLSNSGIYSNVTTATVGIASTGTDADRPDGFVFRVQVSATDATTVISEYASLDYA